ncbi:unnamed protein product [Meganyctiphanes norvegica]|uniref:Uncharacterized protein n=1 Tax=Meganyctiphanes norvegica TaxID=48144 RepID=A0AAV2QCA8_MEGNR
MALVFFDSLDVPSNMILLALSHKLIGKAKWPDLVIFNFIARPPTDTSSFLKFKIIPVAFMDFLLSNSGILQSTTSVHISPFIPPIQQGNVIFLLDTTVFPSPKVKVWLDFSTFTSERCSVLNASIKFLNQFSPQTVVEHPESKMAYPFDSLTRSFK